MIAKSTTLDPVGNPFLIKIFVRETVDKTIYIGYEIIERNIDKHSQVLLIPDIEFNTWWTNLDWIDLAVIDFNHAHAECEQLYSEIKTDMDVKRRHSGKFGTNALVLELMITVYNLLKMIGQESLKLKPDVKKWSSAVGSGL